MQHFMFDIDGTLVESFDFDERCFVDAVVKVTGKNIDEDWSTYPNITDRGLLKEIIVRHNLDISLLDLEALVKPIFVDAIRHHVHEKGIAPLPGALKFFQKCCQRKDIQVSLATGGWLQTAQLKLAGAGFLVEDVILASSDDHFERVNIMQLAAARARDASNECAKQVVYFGDGEWDQEACEQLGYQFIQIGQRFRGRHQQVDNFNDVEKIMGFIR